MIAGVCAFAIAACPYVLIPALVFLGIWSLNRARDRARQEAHEHNERTDMKRMRDERRMGAPGKEG